VGVDGTFGIVEIKGRVRPGQAQVGLVEGPDGADIFPVTVEIEAEDAMRADGPRDDVAAEIILLLIFQEIEQNRVLDR
jgi:hypothetical protein